MKRWEKRMMAYSFALACCMWWGAKANGDKSYHAAAMVIALMALIDLIGKDD